MTNQAFDALRNIILKLPATGVEGFEGLIGRVLTEITSHVFALASSGSQGGKDGRTVFANAIAFEGKRYDDTVPKDQIVSRLAEAALDRGLELWVLGATAPISLSLRTQVEGVIRRF